MSLLDLDDFLSVLTELLSDEFLEVSDFDLFSLLLSVFLGKTRFIIRLTGSTDEADEDFLSVFCFSSSLESELESLSSLYDTRSVKLDYITFRRKIRDTHYILLQSENITIKIW